MAMRNALSPKPVRWFRLLSCALFAGIACLAFLAPASAQQSASYKLNESAINSGGDPTGGVSLASASWRIKLDAIGDGILGANLASASFHMDGGFVSAYPPPGEVMNLNVEANARTLTWDPERSVGDYNLYRELVSTLPGLGYGRCSQSALTFTAATDVEVPPVGRCYFYLVTAENRLSEEGTKGFDGAGRERPNPVPCP